MALDSGDANTAIDNYKEEMLKVILKNKMLLL